MRWHLYWERSYYLLLVVVSGPVYSSQASKTQVSLARARDLFCFVNPVESLTTYSNIHHRILSFGAFTILE